MKHKLFFLIFLLSPVLSFAQTNVGIGTTTPNQSAALDVTSNNKGLLVPRISLQSLTDIITIPSPANSLLIYNTNAAIIGGKGFYFNNGTTNAASWIKLNTGSGLVFPFYWGDNSGTSVFQIDNYNNSTTSSAIKGYGGGNAIAVEGAGNFGIGIYGHSNSGTGILATSSTGDALKVDGKIKLLNLGSPVAAGKVLTSDANGNATWEGAVAFSVEHVTEPAQPDIPPYTNRTIPFANKLYDLGNNYNLNTHVFSAPVNGIYHFNVQASWNFITDDLSSWLHIVVVRAGQEILRTKSEMTINSNGYYSMTLGYDAQLLAGDQVYPQIYHNASVNMALAYNGHQFFTGHLVVKL